MHASFVEWLRCPVADCGGRLVLDALPPIAGPGEPAEIESGRLDCTRCGASHPIVDAVPRFAGGAGGNGDSFGFQWNRFRRTQLDSHSGLPISRERFLRSTGWSAASLAGARLLDVGCGAGRFVEVALDCGATVVAVDRSSAVDACRANFRGHPRLHVVQADLHALPFAAASFDFVVCLGVLQHTPDPRRALLALPPQVKPGGRLAADVYAGGWRRLVQAKYWLRPLTTRLPPRRLFGVLESQVPRLLAVRRAASRAPLVGRVLRRLIPVADYSSAYPLDERQLREWALLDTFDMLAPSHDRPQPARVLRRWAREAGLREAEVARCGHLVVRGRKAD
jgi:SAM-dependent methyltransferase